MDVILFATGLLIFRISATGGAVSPVTSLVEANGELRHVMLFPCRVESASSIGLLRVQGGGGIYAGSLDLTERIRLLDGVRQASYANGFLVFVRDATLMAQPFDADRLELTGAALPLAEQIQSGNPPVFMSAFSVS